MTNRLIERVTEAGGRPIPDAATGEIIGHAREDTIADLQAMISRGVAAQRSWAELSSQERGSALHAAAAKVAQYAEELADAVSREQGKPLNGPGARVEVEACQGWLHTNADLELADFRGRRVCCVVSGGNVDEDVYAAVLRHEL